MAEKKSWRDYSKYESGNSSSDNEQTGGWRSYSKLNTASTVADNVVNSVNTWLENHNNYITNYQSRYSGRKYSYEDAYVNDSSSWLDTVSKQKSNFDAEADRIISYMDQHKGYLDPEWMRSVRDSLNRARTAQGKILESSTKDNEWWNSFNNEELVKQYGSAEDAYKYHQRSDGYSKKYSGQKYDDIQKALATLEDGEEKDWLTYNQYGLYKNDSTYNSVAASGWKSYEAQKTAEQQKEGSKSFWEKVAESYAYAPADTSLPAAAISNAQAAYRNDTTYREPNDKWSNEQKNHFGYLYSENPAKAYEYAEQVNNQINATAKYEQQQQVGSWASQNFGTGTLGTLGAIATAPLGMADFLDNIVEYSARGTITQKGTLSPFDMGQAAQSGVANKLNEAGTFDEDLFIIGGKGLGDVYSLGVSAANSLVSAYTLGGTGTLVNFIGQGGAAGVDDALSRGATAGQALLYGSIVGAAEGVTEMIGADNLLKVGSSATLKNFLLKALNQGIGETIEEGASSIIGNVADNLIMKDKSNFNATVKEYMENGLSEEEAKKKAWIDMASDVAFDALGGFVTGSTNAMTVGSVSTAFDARKGKQENIDAVKEYGGQTEAIIQEGLESEKKSDSYKLATKYQQKIEKGKTLTGQQIRNLLAANQEQITPKDLKKIQQAAENRLTTLGQTKDVQKVAEIATKRATGQKLTRAEKSFLANSEYGSRVANELLPENIASENYSTEWAEEIGTKQVNAAAYNKKAIRSLIDAIANAEDPNAYKSLESRVDGETPAKVSDTGKSVIRETGEEVDLTSPKIKAITEDSVVLDVNGKDVDISEIDFATDDQWNAFNAIKKIEHITPGVASAMLAKVDTTKPVWGQLNGMDEAFTYGFYNYSEADLKAGNFTGNLTKEQLNDAYKLGQYTAEKSNTDKANAYKAMRTAAQAEAEKAVAEGKEAPKAKNLTISYNEGGGKVVSIDKAGIKDAKRSGAVEVAKILHKMDLGTRVEFFSSYLSKTLTDDKGNAARVFLDDNGVEQKAYSGVYRKSDGTIRVDLNAYNGKGLTLNALAHELTHFIQQWSDTKYKALADFLIKAYEKTDMTMHERVLREQARLEGIRKEEVSYDEAFDEVVANAMMKMFDDGKLVERLTELKAQDEKLARKLWEGFKKILAKFLGIYENAGPLFRDTADIMAMKETFEQLQNMFAEALVEGSENYQASLTAAESQTLTEAGIGFDEDTKSVYSLNFSTALNGEIHVGKKTFDTEAIAQLVAKVTGRSIKDARKWVKSEMTIANMVLANPEFLDFEADNRYEAIKKNSDYPQGTVDLSNLCPKREEFTAMFDMLQKKYPNKLFTAQDVADMRKILASNDITVACGACFVEDRRQLLGEIADTYINMWKEAVETGKPLQKTNAAGVKSDLLVTKALAKQYGLTAGTKIMATDTYIPTQYDLTTYEGFKLLEKNHPTIAMGFNRYNNSRGQQSARLIEGRAEYNRQILGWSDAKVRSVNNNGGLRIFSFSDFEVVHLLDLVQVIIDCAAKGVKIQGYTKIPAFAKLVRGTGIKLNRSLIPQGDYGYHMENGKVVLDYDNIEGIDINDDNFIDESDNPDVGNIVIGINPTQIGAAMLDPFIDYIIPFHSNKAKEILKKLGTGEWVNYKESQHEKDISTGKASKRNVNIYTEVINKYHPKNKVEFVDAFLKECKRQGKVPRYAEFLNVDANGDYAYREGYHKLLVDFKMFDADGNILPQGNITPSLDENFMKELLNAEIDRKQNYEFPQKVYDAIDKKFGEQYSSQETDVDTEVDSAYDSAKTTKETEQGVNGNEKRKETREAFLGRAGETSLEVRERGSLAFGYRRYSGQLSQNIQAAEKELKNLGIPVVVFEHMEGNKDGATTIYSNDALSIPGVAVFIHKDATLDAVEIVGHEGYHYLRGTANRIVYREVVAENIDFSSKAIIDYQQKYVGDSYFSEDVVIGSKEWDTLIEELFAYITGHIHAGDPKGEVHKFLRDYDAVKAAWDDLLKKQAAQKGQQYSSQETDLDNAPTFYSKMGKVVEGMKQEKFGASSVISMLTGRGVKAEEIRWSGIQAFLDGKKSVTKQELLDFINSSMLQIEEQERGGTKKYSPEQQKRLNELEYEIEAAWDEMWELWEQEFQEDIPIEFLTSNFVERRAKKIITNANTEAGTEISKDSKRIIQLARLIDINKEEVENISYQAQTPETKWDQYKLDGGANYRELVFKIPGATYTNMAMQGHWGVDAQGVLAHARIQDFDTADGKMLFIEEIQSDWHNQGHKDGYRKEGEKTESMLRAESKKAYEEFYTAVEKMLEDNGNWEDDNAIYYAHPVAVAEMFEGNESYFDQYGFTDEQRETIRSMVAEETARQEALKTAPKQEMAPDAPFKETYHEFVLKRLLRIAAEEGYDSIGWTTADLQMERWNPGRQTNEMFGIPSKNPNAVAFEEGYSIEYDKKMRKFMEKFGRQWGTTVGKTDIQTKQMSQKQEADLLFMADMLEDGEDYIRHEKGIKEVWSMDITPAMKESVLKEGQELYSSQETDLDTDGKKLGEDQLEYFEKSMARDRKGRLQVVYHGGTVEFEFDTTRGGNGSTQYGPGAYFTDSEYYAKEYTWYRGGNVRAYYLNIEKMFDDTNMDATVKMPQWKKLEQILRNNGIEDKFINGFANNGFAYMSRYLGNKAGSTRSDSWGGSEILNGMLREAGFDGIKGTLNDMYQYTIFTPNQAKLTTNEVPSSFYDTRYSEHDTDYSNRSLLANAFETITNGSEEYKLIQKYKGYIAELNSLENKLSEFNRQIRKIRFGTDGEYDAEKLKKLEGEAKKIAEAINKYDQYLLSLEASEPLRKVIERERKKEAQKTKEHVKEIQQNKKVRAEQTELRHKIRKAIRDLDKILNRGNKKLNVKEDMKGFVSKALDLADYLFTDHISNDELIRRGIDADLVTAAGKAQLLKETEDIIAKLDAATDINHPNSKLTDEEFTRLDAKRKANEDKLRDLLTAQRNRRLDVPVYNLFNDLATEYASLKNSKQDAVKAAYNEELEKSLRAFMSDDDRVKILKNMRVADMTTEELNWLYRAYTMVLTNVRNANKFHTKGMNETIDQMVTQIVSDFGSRKIPEKELAIAAQKLANKIGWDYEKLYYALDRIGSEAFTKLIMNLADSENIVMQDVMEAAAFRDKIVKEHGFNNWDINKKIDREFLDNTGKKFTMTLGQLMSLYAYSRREGAWDHIEYGGFVFSEAALTNPKPADSYKLSKEQCEAITNTLTKEQKAYVEDMQKYLSETMGEKGNEVSMQLYGIKMFNEKNYFPIRVSGDFKPQANESQAKASEGFQSMSNAGFTHAQNPNAKAPFMLEGFNEVWTDHVNEMSRYHGSVPALEDIRRVMNRSSYSESAAESTSVKVIMKNHYGEEAVKYFDNLYREANSGAIQDRLQKKSKKLLSMFRKNSVAYKLSVLVQQPASLVRAYAMVDRKYFGIKGVGAITSGVAKAVSSKWNKAYTNAYNEMLKYAPGVTMAKEIGGFDTATGGSIRSYLLDTNKSFKQKWKTENAPGKGKAVLDLVDNNVVANLPNVADKIAWIEIWNACKRETVATHKDLVPNSEEFMQAVGERFTEVIRATQVYDSIFAKSPMLKSKNLAVQYLVSFMNEPNTIANMVEKAVRDVTKGDVLNGLRTAHVVVHSIIFTNLLKSIIYAMHDDDEDETYIEKYIEAVVGNVMSDFNPISYIPFGRDALSLLQGYDVERPDMAIIGDAIDAVRKKANLNNADIENMTEEQLIEFEKKVTEANWKLVESVAAFFGIPLKNVRRDINAIFINKSAPAGQATALSIKDTISEAIVGSNPFMSGKSKQDKLYDAIMSGDKAYVGRLKSTYKTDDAYHTAVRKALRENDPRIKEAAQARYDGNTDEYKRIFREIQNEGKFSFDDIMSAINTELSKLTPDKVTSDYTASGYVEAIAMGNTSEAQAMKEDIIATKIANGMTQEEAETEFASNVATGIKKAYSSGLLDETRAEKMLVEYAGMDEEDAVSRVGYWSFLDAHPEYDQYNLSESNVNDYLEFAEPAEIPMDVFVQYINGTKGLKTIKDEWGDVEVTKREQVLEVIDSLDLTWQQKDALYLAAGYSEDEIWDVPW